ncbi:hypothetical protein [Kitasatospora sp. NPDC127060]
MFYTITSDQGRTVEAVEGEEAASAFIREVVIPLGGSYSIEQSQTPPSHD